MNDIFRYFSTTEANNCKKYSVYFEFSLCYLSSLDNQNFNQLNMNRNIINI